MVWLTKRGHIEGGMVVEQAVHGAVQAVCDPVVEGGLAGRGAPLPVAKHHATQAEGGFREVSAWLCNDIHTCKFKGPSMTLLSMLGASPQERGLCACDLVAVHVDQLTSSNRQLPLQ